MAFDTLTIVVGSSLLLLSLLTPLCSPFFRRPTRTPQKKAPTSLPALSVVIAVHDNAAETARNLPAFLSQEYDGDYEVIVVNDSASNDTSDILTRLSSSHPHLYTTFIPESSHYLSRRKLALTVGVKAAKNEWIVFTDIDCRPVSDLWIKTISEYCSNDIDMVVGYTNYDATAKSYYRFDRLQSACYQLRKAQNGTAYRYDGHCLAIRRSMFMARNGFLRNLKYLRGEYDFLVNEYATAGRTAVMTDADGLLRQDVPSSKSWISSHLYYMETRKHLHRSLIPRLLYATDNVTLHLNYAADIAVFAYSIAHSNWILAAAAGLSLIIATGMRTAIAHRTVCRMGEKIPLWRLPLMEIRVAWQNMLFMLRHRLSDKSDYIRK
jgi:glycosyltransferase involved in cell wall biosynthesis